VAWDNPVTALFVRGQGEPKTSERTEAPHMPNGQSLPIRGRRPSTPVSRSSLSHPDRAQIRLAAALTRRRPASERDPEQVSNLANGVAVLEQLGRPIQDGRFQVVCHPPDSCPPRFAHECLDDGLERSLRALVSGMPQSVSKVRRVSTFAQTGGSLSHRLHS
jgi:hypothetical protein